MMRWRRLTRLRPAAGCMSPISEAKLTIVRSLVAQAPDTAVSTLLRALPDGALDAGLAAVRGIVEHEAQDRRARNSALAPIAPLCGEKGFSNINFPARTLTLIWKGLKALAPADVDRARVFAAEWRPEDASPKVLDALCKVAADALATRNGPDFAAAADAADAGSGAGVLIECLRLAEVTRHALDKLPDWLGRMTDEKAAALRLAYRDVVDIDEAGGPLFFEMLSGALSEPWLILRAISGAMSRPAEAYLAASELSSFGERLLVDIEAQSRIVAAFTPDAGIAGAEAAARAALRATVQIAEFEQSLVLAPDGVWGRRVGKLKRAIASAVEQRLRDVDDAVSHALPLQAVRTASRSIRSLPKLAADPDPRLVERASSLLHFMHEVRVSAQAGGFASARAKAVEILEARLDGYVEDLLGEIRAGEVADEARARAYLEVAAEFSGVALDDKSAQLIRRRAAAA